MSSWPEAPHAWPLSKRPGTLPIVFAAADAVTGGLVTSLRGRAAMSRGCPCSRQEELVGKRLELLKQAVPGISRVAVLGSQVSRTNARKDPPEGSRSRAQPYGMRVQFVEARGSEDFDRALLVKLYFLYSARAGALTMITSSMLFR